MKIRGLTGETSRIPRQLAQVTSPPPVAEDAPKERGGCTVEFIRAPPVANDALGPRDSGDQPSEVDPSQTAYFHACPCCSSSCSTPTMQEGDTQTI